jgi:aspartate kinase
MAEGRHEHDEMTGIASTDGFCVIHLSKYMMNREIGFGRRLLQILEEERLCFEHAPSGIDNMSVILDSQSFTTDQEQHVLSRIQTELGANDVTIEHGARACAALAEAGVNIEFIDRGSCEISIMFGVRESDRKRAVRALGHALLLVDESQ